MDTSASDPALALAHDQVRELSKLEPRRAICDTAVRWLWIFAAWALAAYWPAWWTILGAFLIVGTQYYALFVIGHDGLHRRIFEKRQTNDLFNDLFILGPIGCITRLNRINHITHHRLLATAADPDRHKYGCFNKAWRHELFGYLVGFTSFVRSARNVLVPQERHATVSNRIGDEQPTANENARYSMRDIAIIVGWQMLLIISLSLILGPWAYFILWILPVYCCTFLADNLRSFLEHSRPEPDVEADQRRLISYISNPVERLLIAPMNMNFHAVHHLWPSIPYYNLPQADREIRSQKCAPEIEWRQSYCGYLWQYIRALPMPNCKQPLSAATSGE